jgi:hypothetical protein
MHAERDVEQDMARAGVRAQAAELVHDRPYLLVARSGKAECVGNLAEPAIRLRDAHRDVVEAFDRGDQARVDPRCGSGHSPTFAEIERYVCHGRAPNLPSNSLLLDVGSSG